MFKHLVKISQQLSCLNTAASYKYIRHGCILQLSRQFSSEMTADWPQSIRDFLQKEKITDLTKIQARTLPLAMANQDLVGVARTGSGKTLAFVIPAIMKILKEREGIPDFDPKKERQATCLILAPTRELATQTHDVLKKFANLGIRSIVLVGGTSRAAQVNDLLYKDHDVYIATPGRLKDLSDGKEVDLSNIKYLVLDEADRMLDMGFEPQIREIIERLPQNRQTLMWSATWPPEIQSLAETYMTNYEQIAVDSETLKANPNIKQIVKVCAGHERLKLLLDQLSKISEEVTNPRILVFVNTKRMADTMIGQLMRYRHRAVAMHGDRSQNQRDRALRLFKEKQCNILVATDVAARGLDINDITHVINFDFPNTIEDYIHRIGRTARHDKSGTSVALFSDSNNPILARKLVEVLSQTNQEIPDQLLQLSQQRLSVGRSRDDQFSRRRSRDRNDFYGRQESNQRNYGRRNFDEREFGERQDLSKLQMDLFDDDEDQHRSNLK